MTDKEAVEAIAVIIYEAMRFDRKKETPVWKGGNSDAETEARVKAIRALAAARPHILEEAARIAETTMNHQRVDGHTMTFPGDPKSIAAAIRAAKEG